jgi:hypothetical protein
MTPSLRSHEQMAPGPPDYKVGRGPLALTLSYSLAPLAVPLVLLP